MVVALLPHRDPELWYHRCSSRTTRQPVVGAHDTGTTASSIFDVLPHVRSTTVPCVGCIQLTPLSRYIILQGLSGVAGGFLQGVPLAIYYVKLIILGSTPRSVYDIKYGLRSIDWGTTFPGITLLVVITLAYSIISPIINGLACVTFLLFYMMYKYLFLWVYQQPSTGDTGGLFFPKAIGHIFVGMYVQQLCLAALFFLAQNQNKEPSAIPEGVFMILLIVITVSSPPFASSEFFLTAIVYSSRHPITLSSPTRTGPFCTHCLLVLRRKHTRRLPPPKRNLRKNSHH
jgi:hypothetical protein